MHGKWPAGRQEQRNLCFGVDPSAAAAPNFTNGKPKPGEVGMSAYRILQACAAPPPIFLRLNRICQVYQPAE